MRLHAKCLTQWLKMKTTILQKGAVAFRCRKRFLRPDGVYRYSEWAKKRLEKHIKSKSHKIIMALRFIKCLISRKAITFYYDVFRSALNATAPLPFRALFCYIYSSAGDVVAPS